MTRTSMVRRFWAALFSATLVLLLGACGSSSNSDNGNSSLRILNATSDLPQVDVYLNDDKKFGPIDVNLPSAYGTYDADSYVVKVKAAGDSATVFSGTYTLSGDKTYTGVVWGRNGSLRFATLPEDDNTDDISAGSSRIRVYNATTDAGSLDVYLTQGIDDLANATPVATSAASAVLGAYRELSSGTYRLRVTSAGDITDVRLDVSVTLDVKQFSTLIVTAGPGGVLVNGGLLVQQGTLSVLTNTQARVRVVAGAENTGGVTTQIDGNTIANLRSPRVGPYTLVTAGSRSVNVGIDGTTVLNEARTFTAGADYTLVVDGTPAASQVSLISDDNRLPASGRYRIRVINASASAGPVTLSVDFKALVSDVQVGQGSAFVTGTATTGATVDVTSSNTAGTLKTLTDVKLQSLGVYTLFVLGGNETPTVTLSQDR